nr:hypothetical protein [Tanacetum cinerariifolium]
SDYVKSLDGFERDFDDDMSDRDNDWNGNRDHDDDPYDDYGNFSD